MMRHSITGPSGSDFSGLSAASMKSIGVTPVSALACFTTGVTSDFKTLSVGFDFLPTAMAFGGVVGRSLSDCACLPRFETVSARPAP